MLSLIEELKNHCTVVQTNSMGDCTKLVTEWTDTHNKAVKLMIDLLKGYTTITLPYLPSPYVINDRDGKFQGVVNLYKGNDER